MDKDLFKNPDQTYRNGPFWSWNDLLNSEECENQLETMTEQGWGNYFMHSRVGLVTGYLSDKWMEIVRKSAEKGKELGRDTWLYDEDKWPSGFAGGESVKYNPDFRARAVVLLKPENFNEETDTLLTEHIEEGEKYIICERVSRLGDRWFNGYCYIDLMNPEAVKEFIRCTHERYKESVGDLFGNAIKGIFTDEPCYSFQNGAYNAPFLQWSRYLPDFFQKLRGYSLIENLPSLFFKTGDYKKIRYHYYDASTRLFAESFSKQYGGWCQQNNLIMTGHMMAEDELVYQTRWIGSAMPHYEYFGWPGIDKLCRHIEQHVTVKQLTSAADQLQKERAMCEVFGCMGQQSSFFERKWISDWQAALGINFVNPHLTLYSQRGERKRDYPANLSWSQPWWKKERPFADYTARLSYALTCGKRRVEILVIHTVSSIWSVNEAIEHCPEMDEAKKTYSRTFDALAYKLTAENLDFHFGDEIIMEKHACVNGPVFKVGSGEYSVVIVPPASTLSSNTVNLLEEFIKNGGDVIYTSQKPDRIDGEITEREFNGILSKDVDETIDIAKSLFPDRIKTIAKNGNNIDKIITHIRDEAGEEIVFLTNTSENESYDADIVIATDKTPVIYNLFTGERQLCPYTREGGKVTLSFNIAPAGSLLLIFTKESAALEKAPHILESGVEFESNLKKADSLAANFSAKGKNSIVINYATVKLGDKTLIQDDLIAKVWHYDPCRREHFYGAPEGTPFEAVYKFNCTKVPDSEVFAAIETAENLDSITFNGHPVTSVRKPGEPLVFDDKCFLDTSLTKVDISGKIIEGVNELIIRGRKCNNVVSPGCHVPVKDFEKHRPTEIEAIYIVGDFGAAYENGRPVMRESVNDRDYYPTYTGTFEYTAVADGPDISEIELENAKCACAELFINGKSAGVRYIAPFKFNIEGMAGSGQNEIKAVIYPTLFNMTGPTWISNLLERRDCNPGTFLHAEFYTDTPVLIKYGIDGFQVR